MRRSSAVLAGALLFAGCVAEQVAEPASAPPLEQLQSESQGEAASDSLQSVLLTVELNDPSAWRAVEGNAFRCEGDGSLSLERYRAGQSVALIGPDGNQLSADLVSDGFIRKSQFRDDDENVCAFFFLFTNVPEVATYRVQEPDGTITTLVWALQRLRDDDWRLSFSYN